MRLGELSEALGDVRVVNGSQQEIRGLTLDSRRAGPGDLFAAVPGPRGDGTGYVADAVARGAAAILASTPVAVPADVALLVAPDVRCALADLACRFHGRPADRLEVVGITGTNGKTTVATLVWSLLRGAGRQAALLSTVVREIGAEELAADNTTPESVDLQGYFAEMVRQGIRYAVMEVSSHSLAQERVRGVRFRVGALTNLTANEHTDFHGSPEAYRDAKAKLFESLGPDAVAVLNRDDPLAPLLQERTVARVTTFGMAAAADVRAAVETQDLAGTTFRLSTPVGARRVRSPLIGRFNVMNLLAGTGCALALGLGLDAIAAGIEQFEGAPGRLERVSAGQPFTVLVDYAHNHDGLSAVLETLRDVTPGRLIVVFGAGGDREPSKRPLMGAAAARHADVAFVTADNSRSERTEDIIEQIVAGMGDARQRRIEPDRKEAIRQAIAAAEENDVVLIAGKGHETYQEIAGVRHPFSDREEARSALLSLSDRWTGVQATACGR